MYPFKVYSLIIKFTVLYHHHHNLILEHFQQPEKKPLGFPGGAVVENLPANAGDMCSSPGLGRSHMPRSN